MKRKILASIISIFIAVPLFANDLALETVGAMGGSNIYLTYLSIGIIADCYGNGIYEKEQTISLISSIEGQAKVQKDYLDKWSKSKETSADDKAFIKRMIGCYNLLLEEAKYLKEYANTKKDSAVKNFDAKRQQAWKDISELLGLN
ncbi:MAG: hypothetical protein FWF73_03070 [Spirochaetes bacterium]|nr:hypothetical protein [Spirochaetota bacterium]